MSHQSSTAFSARVGRLHHRLGASTFRLVRLLVRAMAGGREALLRLAPEGFHFLLPSWRTLQRTPRVLAASSGRGPRWLFLVGAAVGTGFGAGFVSDVGEAMAVALASARENTQGVRIDSRIISISPELRKHFGAQYSCTPGE